MSTGALCLAALGLAANAGANTSNGYNLPTGVTDLARDMYGLHMEVFWICVGIAVVVFGAMIYTLVKFRHSQGAVADTTMLHSTKVEIIWTIIPAETGRYDDQGLLLGRFHHRAERRRQEPGSGDAGAHQRRIHPTSRGRAVRRPTGHGDQTDTGRPHPPSPSARPS